MHVHLNDPWIHWTWLLSNLAFFAWDSAHPWSPHPTSSLVALPSTTQSLLVRLALNVCPISVVQNWKIITRVWTIVGHGYCSCTMTRSWLDYISSELKYFRHKLVSFFRQFVMPEEGYPSVTHKILPSSTADSPRKNEHVSLLLQTYIPNHMKLLTVHERVFLQSLV